MDLSDESCVKNRLSVETSKSGAIQTVKDGVKIR